MKEMLPCRHCGKQDYEAYTDEVCLDCYKWMITLVADKNRRESEEWVINNFHHQNEPLVRDLGMA